MFACGPFPDELDAASAAETAATATSTPTVTPTPTPTPIPYDLSVVVFGEDNIPIMDASVLLVEDGEEGDIKITNESGQASWFDLPGEVINLSIDAQGYFSAERSEIIRRGENQVIFNLDRDPFGILPSDACLQGEQLLYIEDFQDQQAQGWSEIDIGTQDWEIIPHPDNPNNYAVSKLSAFGQQSSYNDNFVNSVWRFKIMHIGNPVSNFSWQVHIKEKANSGWSSYAIWIHFPDLHVNRKDFPNSDLILRLRSNVLKQSVWQQIEISTFEGRLELWIDGVPWVQYDDPQPLPGGSIAIGVGLGYDPENTSRVYYDDFIVCSLSEPVQPLPTP